MNDNNPNNIKVGDTIYIEEAWEDDAGYYHDEYAEVIEVEDDGTLHLKFDRPDVTEFLSTASFSADDYTPLEESTDER